MKAAERYVPRRALSPAEAAESIGVSERTIRALLASGELRSARFGSRHVIHIEDLDELVRRRRDQGSPEEAA
jgi:excisionase family DNA binding protein